ncbi:MAG: ADP-ribosylglycohydrolase family protein [Streptomyces sp.]|uniref:ADP-ribosylglycohydrolase family protein n=1 Tax=Streptomyces sp. TaxID=1931 RepID=UPI003D6A2196
MSAAPHDLVHGEQLDRALASLHGLRVGDALGAQFSLPGNRPLLRQRRLPAGPWRWTDDTEMACSMVAVLDAHRGVEQDALAAAFAEHHDDQREYGPAVHRMLRQIRQEGADWRELAGALFDGRGSWGNGAAMRAAPLGAWFAGDPLRAAEQAELSARVTHQHPEAVAGTVAVAVASALVAGGGAATTPGERRPQSAPAGELLLERVLEVVPRSAVAAGLRRAGDMLDYGDVETVAAVLGCGRRTSAHDTVPFTLWAAVRHLGDYEQALWTTARAGGDVDTTCAIVGGIVASGTGSDGDATAAAPPPEWAARTEPLPAWVWPAGGPENSTTPGTPGVPPP